MKARDYDVTLLRVSEKFSDDGDYYYRRCQDAGVREIESATTSTAFSEAEQAS